MEGTKYLGKGRWCSKAHLWSREDQDIWRYRYRKFWGQSRCCSPSILSLYEGWQKASSCWRIQAMWAAIAWQASSRIRMASLIEVQPWCRDPSTGSYAWRRSSGSCQSEHALGAGGGCHDPDGKSAPRRFIWVIVKSTISKNWPIRPWRINWLEQIWRPWFWGVRYLARYRKPLTKI